MYCPSCGTEYTIELKYCNRCGANLSSEIASPHDPVIFSLTKPVLITAATLVILTLGGFGGLIGGAIALASVVQRTDPLIAIIVFGMLTIMIVDIFLVRQLSKLISATLPSSTQPSPRRPHQLTHPSNLPLPQLATERLQGVPSVTEGTTRFFEPYRTPAEAEVRPTPEKLESNLES